MTGFSTLPTRGDEGALRNMQWSGEPKVLGPSWLRMPLLTVGMLGLQIIWSVEMSYGTLSTNLTLIRLTLCSFSILNISGGIEEFHVHRVSCGASVRIGRTAINR